MTRDNLLAMGFSSERADRIMKEYTENRRKKKLRDNTEQLDRLKDAVREVLQEQESRHAQTDQEKRDAIMSIRDTKQRQAAIRDNLDLFPGYVAGRKHDA